MKKSEKNALFIGSILFVFLIILLISLIKWLENRDIYFQFSGMDMEGYNIPLKTYIPMMFSTDCDDWCDNDPSCQAYVISNTSFCTLKSTNRGIITENATSNLFLRQTPDVETVIGSSFTSIYPNTCITDSVISTMRYLSPIDCMRQCQNTTNCTAVVVTTTLSTAPYTCFLHSGSLQNVSAASYSYFIPINDNSRLPQESTT